MAAVTVPTILPSSLEPSAPDLLVPNAPGQPLAFGEMQTLVKRTEGWVAGLVLATSVITQQENRFRVMEIFTGAHTFLR